MAMLKGVVGCDRTVHTPLKPIHLSPTSRISSALLMAAFSGLSALAVVWRIERDSGLFMVMVAAVAMASHVGCAILRDCASFAMEV